MGPRHAGLAGAVSGAGVAEGAGAQRERSRSQGVAGAGCGDTVGEERASVSAKALQDGGAGGACRTAPLPRDADVSGLFCPLTRINLTRISL